MAVTHDKLEHWFADHPKRDDEVPQYQAILQAGKHFAGVIIDNSPTSADQSHAIRHIRNAVHAASDAIACGGR